MPPGQGRCRAVPSIEPAVDTVREARNSSSILIKHENRAGYELRKPPREIKVTLRNSVAGRARQEVVDDLR
jgi:hypothetical protein